MKYKVGDKVLTRIRLYTRGGGIEVGSTLVVTGFDSENSGIFMTYDMYGNRVGWLTPFDVCPYKSKCMFK